jgi:hypothetical protein
MEPEATLTRLQSIAPCPIPKTDEYIPCPPNGFM